MFARQRTTLNRWVVGLEWFIAVTAMAGGILLAIRPDGSLMDAQLSALSGSPFADWRLPGLLLLALVGGGFALAATSSTVGAPWAAWLAVFAGAGLVVFEAVELLWIGPQWLQALIATVGIAVSVLGVPQLRTPSMGARHDP